MVSIVVLLRAYCAPSSLRFFHGSTKHADAASAYHGDSCLFTSEVHSLASLCSLHLLCPSQVNVKMTKVAGVIFTRVEHNFHSRVRRWYGHVYPCLEKVLFSCPVRNWPTPTPTPPCGPSPLPFIPHHVPHPPLPLAPTSDSQPSTTTRTRNAYSYPDTCK